jgi:hypothetical protein
MKTEAIKNQKVEKGGFYVKHCGKRGQGKLNIAG